MEESSTQLYGEAIIKAINQLRESFIAEDLDLINNIQIGDERLVITSHIATSLIKDILKETKANTLKCSKDEMYDIAEYTYPFVISKLLDIKESDLFGFTDGYEYHYLFYKDSRLVKILKIKE